MLDSLSISQIAIVAGLLVIAAAALRLAFKASRATADPIIKASFKELREGWYQVSVTVTNPAPHGFVGVSLRRVLPGSARLMAPITSVSTREGDFQVWSDPASDRPTTTIPVDLVVGPSEAPRGIASLNAEAHTSAWVFLPKQSEPTRLTLELAMRDDRDHLRRYRFNATRQIER